MINEELEAVKQLRNENADSKLLDTIENGLNELKDTIEALESKCSLCDYWRDMVHKQDKILDVLKNHVYAIRNYIYTTDSKITEEESEILKLWLDSNTK